MEQVHCEICELGHTKDPTYVPFVGEMSGILWEFNYVTALHGIEKNIYIRTRRTEGKFTTSVFRTK